MTYKKLSAEEERRLYGVPEQPRIEYPPVLIPGISSNRGSTVAEQLDIPAAKSTRSKIAQVVKSVGIRRVKSSRRFQIGLDFGTSSTKVMYRELGTAELRVRLLDFDHGLTAYPSYCLPATLTFDKAGNLFLADAAIRKLEPLGWGLGLSRLKMLIAGRADKRYLDSSCYDRFKEHISSACGHGHEYTPDALAATYLAAVMRRVRNQLERETGSTELDLVFNTCVPVDQSERTPVVVAFERVLATAAELERNGDVTDRPRVWLDRGASMIETVKYDIEDDAQRFFIMPEAVATAAGYITSIRRKPGIHAVVDIGAGTTDVSICLLTLRKKGGSSTYWYAARSIPMGAGRIEDMIASKLSRVGQTVTQEMILGVLRGDSPLKAECGSLVDDEIQRMWNGTLKVWSDAYKHESVQSAWEKDVTVLLTGGGGAIPCARGVFSRSWMSNWGPYACDMIAVPETFDNREKVPFHRLSVAFGLATPLPELGEHIMPAKSPDHTPPRMPVRDWRQDGDQLLPRWGWT